MSADGGPRKLRHVFDTATRQNPVTAGRLRSLPMIVGGEAGASSCLPKQRLTSKKPFPKEGLGRAPPAGLEPAAKRLEDAWRVGQGVSRIPSIPLAEQWPMLLRAAGCPVGVALFEGSLAPCWVSS
ncbi:hypothetical protein HEK131_40510 [Streptomyces seoulensis]|nr:hypothetical protein HEK131_40510 [Streptomyces seoulensis]